MADIKITGLSAVTPPINKGSLVVSSTFDGVTTYTSEKVTVSQLADAVFLMDAEQKLTFDSSGTNKTFVEDSTTSGNNIKISSTYVGHYVASGSYWEVQSDGVNDYSKAWAYLDGAIAQLGSTGSNYYRMTATTFDITFNNSQLIKGDSTGLGFFNTTPVAQPTGIAVTAGGIHAALVSLGLITA